LTIHVTDGRGLPLTAQVTISNLSDSSGRIMVATSCAPASDGSVTCLVFLDVAGHYELDVGAAGYATQHVAVDMPARKVDPDVCCPSPPNLAAPLQVDVALTKTT
jgi:hypothetical protein